MSETSPDVPQGGSAPAPSAGSVSAVAVASTTIGFHGWVGPIIGGLIAGAVAFYVGRSTAGPDAPSPLQAQVARPPLAKNRVQLSPQQLMALRAMQQRPPSGQPPPPPALQQRPLVRGPLVATLNGIPAGQVAGREGTPLAPPTATIDQDIASAITTLVPQVRQCYDQARGQQPGLAGGVVLSFTLHKDPGGASYAKDGQIAQSSLQAPQAERCMLQRMQEARFPQIKGQGEVKVTYPLMLTPTAQNPGP